MKVVFFGTSSVALPVLTALHQKHTIAGVVTTPDARVGRKQTLVPSPVAVLARTMNLPVLQPETVKQNAELMQQLDSLKADVFVVVSYGKILPLALINLPPLKTINIHFSLLPKYRGAAPIQWAIANGETVTGTTIFILDEALDHGPILSQAQTTIKPADTFEVLANRIAEQSATLVLTTLSQYANGELTPVEQDHSQRTLAPMISKQDGRINWTQPASVIYNRYRGFKPWPGVWTEWNGKTLKITECAPGNDTPPSTAIPGTVLSGGRVVCGDSTMLDIHSVQLEGKKSMSISDFLNGYPSFADSRL